MEIIDNKCDCNCIHESKMKEGKKYLKKCDGLSMLPDFFKTFADTTRIQILYMLDKVGEMCVCDIAFSLNMTKSAISHQLGYLKDNNLVVGHKIGKEVFYSLVDSHVKDILEIGLGHIKEGSGNEKNI